MHVQKDEGVKLYNSCKNSIFVRENLFFGADTLSDLVRFHKAAPNFIYVKKKAKKKKKNSNKHKWPVCLSKHKTV